MKIHKRALSFIMTGAIALAMFPALGGTANADEKIIKINSIKFPDKTFRNYILDNIDTNDNKILDQSEIDSTTSISISNNELRNVEGIQYFKSLTSLSIESDAIRNMFYIDNSTSLKTLKLSGKYMNHIDVRKMADLESLTIIGSESIEGININENKNLKQISIHNCKKFKNLSTKDPSGITYLQLSYTGIVDFDHNENTTSTFDFSGFTNLKTLELNGSTNIKAIDISKCTKLEYLDICNTNLTSLDLSNNKALRGIFMYNSGITELDITNLYNIKWLIDNGRRETNVSKRIVSIIGRPAGDLECRFDYDAWKTTLIAGDRTITPYPEGYVKPNAEQYSFVERMYTTCMKRESDPEGKEHWATHLAAHEFTGEFVGVFFFLSDEMIGYNLPNEEYITRLYKTFMDRDPEQEGFDFWCQFLNEGHSKAEIVLGFTRSPEFIGRCENADIIPYQ